MCWDRTVHCACLHSTCDIPKVCGGTAGSICVISMSPATRCCKNGAQVLVLKPGCYLQHLERPQRKETEIYPSHGSFMFILQYWKIWDINYLSANKPLRVTHKWNSGECFYMPTVFEQIYWCFLKTFTLWTSNSKIEAEDSDSHFAVIALFGHLLRWFYGQFNTAFQE